MESPEKLKKFFAEEIVNGVKISCKWEGATSDGAYFLDVSMIVLDENGLENEIDTQILGSRGALEISDDLETAQRVFEYSKQLAKTVKDSALIIGKSSDFLKAL